MPHDLLIDLRPREAERQVLELPLHLPDTEAVRERRVELERFRGVDLRVIRRVHHKPAQRLQTARETKEHDPEVAAHREQHLSQLLGLGRGIRFLVARTGLFGELHQTLQIGAELEHLAAETLLNPLLRILQIILHGGEIGRGNQFIIPDAPQNAGHAVCVRHTGFACLKALPRVERFHHRTGKLPVHFNRRFGFLVIWCHRTNLLCG